jgi:predicted nucleic acid-binding protein
VNVYIDTSALIQRYLAEAFSDAVSDLLSGEHIVGSSVVAMAELSSAVRRAVLAARLTEGDAELVRQAFARDEETLAWFTVDRPQAAAASALAWKHGLRGFDAVHLAAAMRWAVLIGDGALQFATFDQRLAEAARTEGLSPWP